MIIARSAPLGERTSLVFRIDRATALLDRFPSSILQLMFRVAIAEVFWSSGMTKIASWQSTVVLFRDEYMVPLLPPEIGAVISATFELSCSSLIFVGLATRFATLPLLGMIFVIEVFVYPEYWAMHCCNADPHGGCSAGIVRDDRIAGRLRTGPYRQSDRACDRIRPSGRSRRV